MKALAVHMRISTHALFCKMEDSSCECKVIESDSDEENKKRYFASGHAKGKLRVSIYSFVTALWLIFCEGFLFCLCKNSLCLNGFIIA